jgi:hypothetical protein
MTRATRPFVLRTWLVAVGGQVAASPAVGVYPGTDLALITYYEAYDIHSATTQVE